MSTLDLEPYRALVEQAPTMLWRGGPDAQRDFVNPAWLRYTGRTLEQELGTGWLDGIHPDDVARYRGRYRHHHERREGFEIELRLRRHDGAYRHVLDRAAPCPGADGSFAGFIGSCVEVDARRDDAATEAAELFEMSLDNLCVAGFDGYLKRVNPSWTRTLGWTAEELMARPSIDFVHPDDRASVLAARKHLADGIPLRALANRYRCKDGSYRWLEWRSVSHVDRQVVYAAARDITQQKNDQLALRELTESLRTTLNSIADGVIATDTRGAIARMNPVAEKLTGWTSAEAAGVPLDRVFRIVDAETRAPASLPLESTLSRGIAVDLAQRTLLLGRHGTELPIASSCAPMTGADGSVSGVVLVFRDMTADDRAREVRDQLQRQLIFAERMAAVGTLAAGVAHEINNPLAYVLGNLDMLVEDLRSLGSGAAAPSVEWATMANDAREGAARICQIVRGLKTMSRADEARDATSDVTAVLELSLSLASNELRHSARIVKDLQPVPPVAADDARLGQVFINLLVNAAQAIADHGGDDHEIRLSTTTDAEGRAIVEIRDTGAGIPAAVLGRVFDPFFTTKPIGVGTGLGLWVCHNIVAAMGGQITASNGVDRGAVFRVILPAAPPPRPPEIRLVPAAAPARPRRRAAVLIVDDDPAVGVVLGRVLRDHHVTIVTSAQEALARIASGASFDVILSDLMMPGMSGMDLFDELVRKHPLATPRVVFVTGGAFTSAASEFLARIPNARIEKPFDPVSVRRLVEKLAG